MTKLFFHFSLPLFGGNLCHCSLYSPYKRTLISHILILNSKKLDEGSTLICFEETKKATNSLHLFRLNRFMFFIILERVKVKLKMTIIFFIFYVIVLLFNLVKMYLFNNLGINRVPLNNLKSHRYQNYLI